MKKTLTFILSAITTVGFGGWGLFVGIGSAQAATTYTTAQVATHNTAADCWLIISGNVYDVTNFIPIHPGGNAIIPYCGTDATAIFDSIHGTTGTAANDLPTYLIGVLGTAPAVLTAPTGIVGTPASTSVALSWTGSTGGVSPITYTILRNGTPVGTTTALTFSNTGLTASTTYSFVIRATDSATPTPGTMSSAAINVMTLGATVSGGGENENEMESESGDDGGHNATSTPPTGGGHHGGGSDDGGHTTGTGGIGTGGGHEHEGGSGSSSSGSSGHHTDD
jgi:hypothetical protein